MWMNYEIDDHIAATLQPGSEQKIFDNGALPFLNWTFSLLPGSDLFTVYLITFLFEGVEINDLVYGNKSQSNKSFWREQHEGECIYETQET